MEQLRIGLIGAGYMGKAHTSAFQIGPHRLRHTGADAGAARCSATSTNARRGASTRKPGAGDRSTGHWRSLVATTQTVDA
jgi:predicted dehydrogenase